MACNSTFFSCGLRLLRPLLMTSAADLMFDCSDLVSGGDTTWGLFGTSQAFLVIEFGDGPLSVDGESICWGGRPDNEPSDSNFSNAVFGRLDFLLLGLGTTLESDCGTLGAESQLWLGGEVGALCLCRTRGKASSRSRVASSESSPRFILEFSCCCW